MMLLVHRMIESIVEFTVISSLILHPIMMAFPASFSLHSPKVIETGSPPHLAEVMLSPGWLRTRCQVSRNVDGCLREVDVASQAGRKPRRRRASLLVLDCYFKDVVCFVSEVFWVQHGSTNT